MNPAEEDTQLLNVISTILSINKLDKLHTWMIHNLSEKEISLIKDECKHLSEDCNLKLHKLAIVELLNYKRDLRDQFIFENKHEYGEDVEIEMETVMEKIGPKKEEVVLQLKNGIRQLI